MKVGAENRKMLIGAIVLALVALALAARMFFVLGETPTSAAAASPSAGQQGPQARRVRGGAQPKLPTANSLDPTLKLDVLRASEAMDYKGSGRNIFDYKHVVIPQPTPSPLPKCPGDPKCQP